MNIFATFNCPQESALYLDDVRINKMIIESAQMMSTVVRFYGASDPRLYCPSFHKHPCTLWVRENQSNFMWLYRHAYHMHKIFKAKHNKRHSSFAVIELCMSYAHLLPQNAQTEFANCTPYKSVFDKRPIIDRYKQFMHDKWAKDVIPLTWTGRIDPRSLT